MNLITDDDAYYMSSGIDDEAENNQKGGEPIPFERNETHVSTMATKQEVGNREPVCDHGYVTERGLLTTDPNDIPCMLGLVSIGDKNSPRRGLDSSPRIGTGEKAMQSTLGKSEWELEEQPEWAHTDHCPDLGPASIDRSPRTEPIIDSPSKKLVKVSPRNKSVKFSRSENDTEPWFKGEPCTKETKLGINAVD